MSATVKVEIKDNHIDEILKELGERAEVALQAIGLECENYAKDDCPVDTGRLKNSISYATKHKNDGDGSDGRPMGTPADKTVYIGSNVEYAVEVEYKDITHRVGKAHFLRDAATTHSDHYKSILEAALKGTK